MDDHHISYITKVFEKGFIGAIRPVISAASLGV
jgi:hypothetical protein